MLDSLEKDYRVDPDRIYAAGHSNGGQFTYLVWQTRGDKIAACAPGAAALAPVILNPDAKDVTVAVKTPRPILIIAGQADSDHFAWQERSIELVRRISHCGDGEPWDGTTDRTLYLSPNGAPGDRLHPPRRPRTSTRRERGHHQVLQAIPQARRSSRSVARPPRPSCGHHRDVAMAEQLVIRGR